MESTKNISCWVGVTPIVGSINSFVYLSWSCSSMDVQLSGAKFLKFVFRFSRRMSRNSGNWILFRGRYLNQIRPLWRREQKVLPNYQKRSIVVHNVQTQKTTAKVPLKKPVLLSLSRYSCLSWNTEIIIVLKAMSWGTRSQSTASSKICFNILF